MQCKALKHRLSNERILGQEVSIELLEVALKLRQYKKGMHKYTVSTQSHESQQDQTKVSKSYLISWHHLKCYISRFVVTEDYLAHLEDTRELRKQRPTHLQRTGSYNNLRNSEELVEVATITVRIAIEMLSSYNSPATLGIVKRLLY